MKKNKICIVEDNRVLRDGIALMLHEQSDMHIVASLGYDENVLLNVSQTEPHVILMDVGMNTLKELLLLESIKKKLPEVKVIGMGFVSSRSDIVEYVEAGVSGFILKDATVKDFLDTIRSVVQGANVLPPSLIDSLFSHVLEHALKKKRGILIDTIRMTKREREIMAMIADGLSNKEIAQHLNIATHTVKSHVHNIMEKLALHTRLQIATFIHGENK
jgi:DNA-binding NarL/FixJ family response regulator